MDISKLTLGELAKIEELGGMSIDSFGDEGKPKMKMLIALAYVIKRREDKNVTLLQIENMTSDEVTTIIDSVQVTDAEKK
jgi:hypothetical protein